MSTQQPSAEEYKEMLIELFSLYWPRGATVEDMSPTTLFKMSALYPELLQLESAGIAIDHLVCDVPHGNAYHYTDVEREAYLRKALFHLLAPDKKRVVPVGLHTLLDEELKVYRANYDFENNPLEAKAIAIAESRATRGIIRIKNPPDYAQNKAKYEFETVLFTLRFRDSGTPMQTKLFFDYKTPFHTFLDTLRGETRLCTMPTKEEIMATTKPVHGLPHISHQDTEDMPVKSLPSRIKVKYFDQSEMAQTSTSTSYPINPTSKYRNDSKRGFTLDDGPWIYRFKFEDEAGQLGYLSDEISYQKMIDQIKLSKKSLIVVLVHSIEKLRLDKFEGKKKLVTLDENERKKSMQGLDLWGDGDPDDIDVYLEDEPPKSKKEEARMERRWDGDNNTWMLVPEKDQPRYGQEVFGPYLHTYIPRQDGQQAVNVQAQPYGAQGQFQAPYPVAPDASQVLFQPIYQPTQQAQPVPTVIPMVYQPQPQPQFYPQQIQAGYAGYPNYSPQFGYQNYPQPAGYHIQQPAFGTVGLTSSEVLQQQITTAANTGMNAKQEMKPADDDPLRVYWVRELDHTWTQRNRVTIDSGDIGECRWYSIDGVFYAVRLPTG
ncbi:hypothetical protein B7463_g1381, partial [Scytalidium lignicola]